MGDSTRQAKPAHSEEPGGYRYYVLGILTLIYALNFLDRQIIGILAVPLKAEFQLSDSQFGLLGGLAFAVLYSTLAIPIAWLADRSSRVWVITTSLTIWSGFTALCGVAGNFAQLFLCRMGVGIGEAGGAAPAFSLISDHFPPNQRARALAVFSLGLPIGTGCGILVGGLVAADFGWRAAFIAVGVVGVILAPILRLTVRDPLRGGTDIRTIEAADPTPIAAPKAPRFVEVVRLLAAKRSFWLLSFAGAASSVCAYGLAAWLPSFFIRSFGLTLSQTAYYYGAITFFGGIAGIAAGGILADRLGSSSRAAYARVPAFALPLCVPFLILAMKVPDFWLALVPNADGSGWGGIGLAFVAFLVPTALNVIWLGPLAATIQHLAPAPMRTTASALLLLINNLIGITVGVFYFGLMSDVLRPVFGEESLRWSLYSGMIFYLIAAALFYLCSRSLDRDWVETH